MLAQTPVYLQSMVRLEVILKVIEANMDMKLELVSLWNQG